MTAVLHVLPHRGGGGETYVDLLEQMQGVRSERAYLASARTPGAGGRSIPMRWPAMARRARAADLVHLHGDAAAAIGSPAVLGRPAVWSTHGLHFLRRAEGPAGVAARLAVRAAIAATSRTVCTSEAESDELARLAPARLRRRLVTVRNGIALPPIASEGARVAARAGLGLSPGELAVLFLGELEPRKAPLLAVEAAEAASARGARVVLLLAGDGPLASEVAARAGEAVRPLGFRSDVPDLLAAADAFVMPSEREGLSMAILEAMGRGLALVVTDGPGNAEAVGRAGVVVPVGDVAALTDVLVRFAGDPDECARLGAAARERAATELSAQRMVAGIERVYADALGATPRASKEHAKPTCR